MFPARSFRAVVSGLAFVCLSAAAAAQTAAPTARSPTAVHVETLAAPELEGRLTGTPGADKAAAYIERELRRKEKALAEAAALLVLSKKLEAIFPKDRDEDA